MKMEYAALLRTRHGNNGFEIEGMIYGSRVEPIMSGFRLIKLAGYKLADRNIRTVKTVQSKKWE